MKAEQLEKIFYGAKEKQNKKSYGVKVPCKANLILSSWHIKAGSTSFCYPMGGQDRPVSVIQWVGRIVQFLLSNGWM